jgi:hypothetical protein
MADIFPDAGEAHVVDILDPGSGVAKPTGWYIGWGTGAGTAAKGDTTLFTEAAESRATATNSQPTADTLRMVGTLTSASGATITNAGILSATTSGELLCKGDFTGVVLGAGDAIEFTFNLQFT